MAKLAPLGQPFGRASQIINSPPLPSNPLAQGLGGIGGFLIKRHLQKQQEAKQQADFARISQVLNPQPQFAPGQLGAVGEAFLSGQAPQGGFQSFTPPIDLSQLAGLQTQAGQQFATQLLGQQFQQNTPQARLQQDLTRSQISKNLAAPSTTQSALIGRLGEKIAAGKATKGELGVFNRLTEKAGTEVNINNIESLGPNIQTQVKALKNSQSIINDFTNDPANAEILKNSDVNVVTNTKGQLQLEVKPKGAPAATQVKELSDLIGLQNSVSTIESLFDPKFTGAIQGNPLLATVAETTGVGTSTNEIQFRRVVSDLSDRLLRARSGAQINEQEFKRLQKILPELGKSDKAFKARLADFKRELQDVIGTKQKAIKQTGKRPLSLDSSSLSQELQRVGSKLGLTTPKQRSSDTRLKELERIDAEIAELEARQ